MRNNRKPSKKNAEIGQLRDCSKLPCPFEAEVFYSKFGKPGAWKTTPCAIVGTVLAPFLPTLSQPSVVSEGRDVLTQLLCRVMEPGQNNK